MNGFTLKCIAALTMLLDHIGAVLFPQYRWLRCIGRIAFPVYCFLLMEGYRHTKSVKKYLMRLGIFALVSEIPFNLAFYNAMAVRGLNVYFTLFLGLMAAWLCDIIRASSQRYGVLGYGAFVLAGLAAMGLKSDYRYYGIALIFVFYQFGSEKVTQAVLSALIFGLMSRIQMYGLMALAPIFTYNGKRGPNHKIITACFYLFYPVHLIILYEIKRCL